MDAAINIERVISARQAIKDARTVKRHAWEAEDLELETQQQRLDAFLLDHLNRTGAKSIATDAGTVYRTEKVRPSAGDWAAIWDWMKANDAPELLERRIKATFVKDFMEEHDGALPPGINVHREYEVSVRRPNTPTNNSSE